MVYDADVPEVFENLKTINDAILIASNPSIELWFLLHYKNQISETSEDACIRDISNRNHNSYKKGVIDEHLKVKLRDKCPEACRRSKRLTPYRNPSTNMHAFIEALKNAKK